MPEGRTCAPRVIQPKAFQRSGTGIDALPGLQALSGHTRDRQATPALTRASGHLVLMTMHRRESWGDAHHRGVQGRAYVSSNATPIPRSCSPLISIRACGGPRLRQHSPGHSGSESFQLLGSPISRSVLDAADIVLTDSGGVHEEALALGKPLILLREVSEWPEAVEAGLVRLVGSDEERIVAETERTLAFIRSGGTSPHSHNPLADGHAAERVVRHLESYLQRRAVRRREEGTCSRGG